MKKDDLNQETLKKKPVKKDDLNQETIKKKPVKKDDLKRMPEELPEKKDEPKSRNPKEKLKCLKCLLMIGVGLRANKSQSIQCEHDFFSLSNVFFSFDVKFSQNFPI